MTKDENSLLLYLETRAVDHSGAVAPRHMNAEDFEIAERWNQEGFVRFGRIIADDIPRFKSTHWCLLSADAWRAVAKLRKEKAKRTWERKSYMTTAEKQKGEEVTK